MIKKVTNQAKMHTLLDHPNIIKATHYFDSITLFDSIGMPAKVSAIVSEYIDNIGDLDDVIHMMGRMPEPLARTYFHQIIDAIEYMHSNDVVHGNLRSDNLLFDRNFGLKIAGFGSSKKCSSNKAFKVRIRDTDYHPPEVYYGVLRKRTELDIFASGVILFLMVMGHMPFSKAELDNPMYKLFVSGQYERFWRIHFDVLELDEDEEPVSEEFRELIEMMFDPNPDTRATLEWIKESEWYQGPLMKPEGLQKFLTPTMLMGSLTDATV